MERLGTTFNVAIDALLAGFKHTSGKGVDKREG